MTAVTSAGHQTLKIQNSAANHDHPLEYFLVTIENRRLDKEYLVDVKACPAELSLLDPTMGMSGRIMPYPLCSWSVK